MKIIAIIILLITLTSCLKTPGELKPDDLVWQSIQIKQPQTVIYERLFDGFRTCGPMAPEGFLIGEQECLVVPGKDIRCDVYLADKNTGRTSWAIGVIRLSENNGTTTMTSGVLKVNDRYKEKTAPAWFAFANGDYKVCEHKPQKNVNDY